MSDYLVKRNGWYHYIRRVPAHLRRLDNRQSIRVALKTKDLSEAARRAIVHNEAVERFWRSLAASPQSDKAAADYREAVARARAFGFSLKSIEEIAEGPIDDLVERLRAVRRVNDRNATAPALLGLVGKPQTLLSAALDQYLILTTDRLKGKSAIYQRKWLNPRKKAIENFIAAVGDKPIIEVTRRDILDFRKWWLEKIAAEDLNPLSANKDLIHLKDILRVMATELEIEEHLDVRVMFVETAFRGKKMSRTPFEAKYVQDKLLLPASFKTLNEEARAVIYLMADTGARVSEITGLQAEDIVLKSDIPHIWIRPNAIRSLKTAQSERQIPLVGAALVGAKMAAGGFPRYAGSDSVSNLINQYMEEHKLRPSPSHTLYSLRHTFKDRLRDVQAPEELIDSLMGHATRGPHYGRGHLLKMKYDWLKKIAFKIKK